MEGVADQGVASDEGGRLHDRLDPVLHQVGPFALPAGAAGLSGLLDADLLDVEDVDHALDHPVRVGHEERLRPVSAHEPQGVADALLARDEGRIPHHDLVDRAQRQAGLVEAVLAQKALHKGVGGVLQDVFRRVELHHAPLVHDDDAVGQGQGLVHVVGDEDDGLPQLLLEPLDQLLEGIARDGVERAEGLVHQDDLGVRGQRPNDAHALLLPAGELRGVALQKALVQPHAFHEPLRRGAPALLVPFQKAGDQRDVLVDRHVGHQADLLDHVADPAAQPHRVHGRDVASVQEDRSARRLRHAVDHAHAGGLSAAAGADEDDELPLVEGEGHALHGGLVALVDLRYVFELEHISGSFLLFSFSVPPLRVFFPLACNPGLGYTATPHTNSTTENASAGKGRMAL